MVKLADGWFITDKYAAGIFNEEVLIHQHPEGSFSVMTSEAEVCVGCKVQIPDSYKMILLLRRLDHEK